MKPHRPLSQPRLFQVLSAAPALALALALAAPAWASDDCKPHPLFTPMQGYHVVQCEYSDFDAKDVPVGLVRDYLEAEMKTVEGIYEYVIYAIDEGVTPSSPLKILRNHLDAAKARGATVVWQPGKESFAASEWTDIQQQIATLRMHEGGREYWVHLGSVNDGDYYAIASMTSEAMVQEVSANELLQQFAQQGFLTLDVHFDTGKASIRAESAAVLDQAASMLQQVPSVYVEVGGHTDNIGSAASNLTLSRQRADSVRAALVQRGIDDARLTAKGYGDTEPVADNRSEVGRAANRRVEIKKTGGVITAVPPAATARPAAPSPSRAPAQEKPRQEGHAGRFARERAENAGEAVEGEAGAAVDGKVRDKARRILDRIL